jgi:DNA-binding NarL/FixJ family response regulator
MTDCRLENANVVLKMKQIKTVLVDDHRLFSEGLERLLIDSEHFAVLKKFNDGRHLLEYLQKQTPDLIILDIEMPALNGLDVLKRLSLSQVPSKVVLLTMHEDTVYAREAFSLGAYAFLNKSMESSLLIESLLSVNEGKKIFPNINFKVTNDSPLSDREITILKLIARGLTSDAIADQLNISPLTVKSHRKNMIQKLKAKNSSELLVKAFERGII